MLSIKNFKLNNLIILNLFISTLPLSLILGNLATNFNIILICLFGVTNYGNKLFLIKNRTYQFLIYSFFLYLILTTAINNLPLVNIDNLYKDHLIKSFFYLRYLLLFLIINKLLENNEFNTRIFFISCSFFGFVVSVDTAIQYIFKKNLIGYPLYNGLRATSFFKEELVVGGYIQKFIIFFIFYLVSLKKNIKYNKITIIILFAIFSIPIFFSLNRMPLVLYVMAFILYFVLEKKFKEILLILTLLISISILVVNFFDNKRVKSDFLKFKSEISSIVKNSPKLFFEINNNYHEKSSYLRHFNTGVKIWKENKIFGNGFKSFRLKCKYVKNQTCNTHPHNYFIEILVDTGLIGITLIYLIFILGIINFLKYYFKEKKLNSRLTSIVFFIIVFFELFPFRSTGSFFTTSVAYVFFIMLPIFLNVKKLQKL